MCMLTASCPTRNLSAWEQRIGILLLSDLLFVNSRGNKDGFGFGEIDGHYYKWEKSAGEVIFTTEYNKTLRYLINIPFIAHVRATSTGRAAKEGAHPFKAGELLLAHNGTFTNYKAIMARYTKQINDKDPVDSHVIACLLADKVGDDALNPEHIATALGETYGSYALLVTDTRSNTIWVITGANPLYIQKSGPLWLVNTSKFNLEDVSSKAAGTARLLYQKVWPIGVAEKIPEYTVHVLTNKGLVERGKLEKPATTVYQRGTFSYYRGGVAGKVVSKDVSTEDARTRAEYADAIVNLPFIGRLELTLACFTLFDLEWWKTSIDDLEVLYSTLAQISDKYGSLIKEELWEELMLLTGGDAYAVVATYTDMAFPYVLNTVGQLRTFLADIQGDKEGKNALANVSS